MPDRVPVGRVGKPHGIRGAFLELDTGLALPLVEACVRQVDLDAGRIVVESGFDESD